MQQSRWFLGGVFFVPSVQTKFFERFNPSLIPGIGYLPYLPPKITRIDQILLMIRLALYILRFIQRPRFQVELACALYDLNSQGTFLSILPPEHFDVENHWEKETPNKQ